MNIPIATLLAKRGLRPVRLFLLLSFGILVLTVSAVHAEERWVTDEFEVMMRSGQNNKQRILRQLTSGTRVEALKVDEESGFTKIRHSSGEEGWVLTRYLRATPTAKLRLPATEQRLQRSEAQRVELGREVTELKKDKQGLQREVAELQSSNRSLQDQVDRITKLSSTTIQVDDQNKQLKQRLADSQQQTDALEIENRRLGSRSNREWFLVGGAVLAIGLLLGLIIPRINWRKKSSLSDF